MLKVKILLFLIISNLLKAKYIDFLLLIISNFKKRKESVMYCNKG